MTLEDAKRKRKIVFDRVSKFTEQEVKYYTSKSTYYDRKIMEEFIGLFAEDPKETNIIIIHAECFENYWEFSHVGKKYFKNLSLARVFMKSKKKDFVLSMMIKRVRWSLNSVKEVERLVKDNKATEVIIALWIANLSTTNYNHFCSYLYDPVFKIGEMVQFRSTIGVDTILKRERYGHGSVQFYGCTRSTLAKMKKSTFMVLEIDPKLEGKVWAKPYSYKEKQGGGRFYKVLPIGETKTYYVVEKFLKKCRTKAVKDARK